MGTQDEGRAALARGRPLVLVTPPAPERAGGLWDLVGPAAGSPGGPALLIVCTDHIAAAEWAEAAPATCRVHAVASLARSARILKDHPPDAVAGAADDLAALLARSALPCDALRTVAVAWPEQLVASDGAGVLDTLLGAVPDAQRIVLSWNPAALADFLERHARRAEVIGALPVSPEGTPLPPVGPARYTVVSRPRRSAALRDVLDQIDARHPLVWRGEAPAPTETSDAVLCLQLPTREEFSGLARLGPLIVFVTGAQLPYLRSLAAPLAPLLLASAADRAHDRREALRARIASRLESGSHDAALALLDPLFERFDPAEVAAAILTLLPDGGGGTGAEPGERGATGQSPSPWTKVFVNVGKKDKASAKDLVGALIREVGVAKSDIGRVDVRDTFSVVEVASAGAERVVRALAGVTIRGRRAQARLDRYG